VFTSGNKVISELQRCCHYFLSVLNVTSSGVNGSFLFPQETLSSFVQVDEDFEKVFTYQFFADMIEAYCNKYFFIDIKSK
jgi:hypothetical protein